MLQLHAYALLSLSKHLAFNIYLAVTIELKDCSILDGSAISWHSFSVLVPRPRRFLLSRTEHDAKWLSCDSSMQLRIGQTKVYLVLSEPDSQTWKLVKAAPGSLK
jgi:hypothetical protein